MTEPLLEAEGLTKHFPLATGLLQRDAGAVEAVDDVDLTLQRGHTLGLVGESGCGKSTLARLLLRLVNPTAGRVRFDGQDLTPLTGRRLLPYRRRMQLVFQDPHSSLNPRMTVRSILREPLRLHRIVPRAEVDARVRDLLERVGLPPEHADRYPHEFSGGQRQRIGIARALATEPDLLVLDEPTSALDVSVQAQILNLLKDLQRDLGLTYLFISHDLSVVRHVSDEVAVMYLGRVVEHGSTDAVFTHPRHPYTRALFSAIPRPDPDARPQRIILEGDVPSASDPPGGCRFHPRCPIARDACRVGGADVAAHLDDGLAPPRDRAATHGAVTLRHVPYDRRRDRVEQALAQAATRLPLPGWRVRPTEDGQATRIDLEPPLEEHGTPGHRVACHLAHEEGKPA